MAEVSLVSLKVFCSYSHNDESLKDELAKHLTMLERQGVILTWHDRKIPPGREWDQQINENLNTADIILLLVSSDFIYSKYCWDVEVTTAIKRHEAGEACVIPIILRNVSWQSAPFAKLQSLPTNAQPVTSWTSKDDAFTNVAQGIQVAAEQLIRKRQQQESEILQQEQAKKSEIPLLLDKVRGEDLRLDVKLEFREAVFGCEKEIRISHLEKCEVCNGSGTKARTRPQTCSTCNGSGQISKITRTPFGSFRQVENCPTCNGTGMFLEDKCDACDGKGTNQVIKKLLITIPAGVDNGTRMRISQQGDAGLRGGSPGDLYVYLFVNEDEEFERDGINILSKIRIGHQQALSGCGLEVYTIDGLVELIIPPKTQPNTIMKLENRGVPRLGNPLSRGDHLMTVIV